MSFESFSPDVQIATSNRAVASCFRDVINLRDSRTGKPFRYHNAPHTFLDVLPTFDAICAFGIETGQTSAVEHIEARPAPAGHDRWYVSGGYGENEQISADITRNELNTPEFECFNGEPADKNAARIIGTCVSFTFDELLQATIAGDFESSAMNIADLSSLGRAHSIYLDRTKKLFQEINELITDTDERRDLATRFLEFNVRFLNNTVWPIDVPVTILERSPKENADDLERTLSSTKQREILLTEFSAA